MEGLKRCPLCSEETNINIWASKLFDGVWRASIFCKCCKICISRNGRTRQDAIDAVTEAWNTRHEPTCRNTASYPYYDFFACSECGARITDDGVGNFTQEFCPACGRKVQDAD